MKIRKPYDERERVQTHRNPDEEERVVQSQAQEVDLNVLVRRYPDVRMIPRQAAVEVVGVFDPTADPQSVFDQVDAARAAFAELPAEVRRACENSPALFLEMLEHSEGRAALQAAGLKPEEIPEPVTPAIPAEPAEALSEAPAAPPEEGA